MNIIRAGLCGLALAIALGAPAVAIPANASSQPAPVPGFTHSAIVLEHGHPEFTVDGKPFFVYGAAFFYERLPRQQWAGSMRALRGIGINTLDLYVPWNWHELSDGDFDFDGRTNPRRDLRMVLRLAREFGFHIILRPGPVVRNEWRNGGYPAWLLERPEYGMPLHDLLEGRYPPTATLQNAHSDDAAVEWMNNATHMTYARRWLERAIREFAPVSGLVIAIALDDDQGAYIDNQTWPAPHFHAYIDWLAGIVHGVTGPRMPVFINTYQMTVTASAPAWAWGNWYQSDSYLIGEHDRSQLEFSTALLATQPRVPVMQSEFQAGWLLQPGDVLARASDPRNTSVALAVLLAMGSHGVVNFPAQDTLDPAGMEAPFANWFYDWSAALELDGSEGDRYAQTRAAGVRAALYGSEIAATHRVADAAIAYMPSAFDVASLTPADFTEFEAQTIAMQQTCRAAALTCDLVDLRFADAADIAKYPFLIVSLSAKEAARALPMDPAVAARLQGYPAHGRIVHVAWSGEPALPDELRLAPQTFSGRQLADLFAAVDRRPAVTGAGDAAVLADDRTNEPRFLVAVNDTGAAELFAHPVISLANGTTRTLPALRVAAHDAAFVVLSKPAATAKAGVAAPPVGNADATGVPIRTGPLRAGVAPPRPAMFLASPAYAALPRVAASRAEVVQFDPYDDGMGAIALSNDLVRVVISPHAGARAFVFEDLATHRSIFTTVGAMRDDVAIEPPLSTTDRIAKYTHDFPAGMFNREYETKVLESGTTASAQFSYAAPDVVPHGATFERTVRLEPHTRALDVDEVATFPDTTPGDAQRAVSVTSLAVGNVGGAGASAQVVLTPEPVAFAPGNTLVATGNVVGLYDASTHELAEIGWRPGDIEEARVLERQESIVVRLTLARDGVRRTRYGYERPESVSDAQERLRAFAAALR